MSETAQDTVPPAPAIARTQPIIVTGGAGFIGTNLSDRLAAQGETVLIIDNLQRAGVGRNLSWLKKRHPQKISSVVADVRDPSLADAVIRARGVFHLAAQVAVTTSCESPLDDLETNICGTVLLLEAARRAGTPPPFIFASTNKVYGDLADIALLSRRTRVEPRDELWRTFGIGESRPLEFQTPYGCSKGAADQYALDYARTWKVPAAVLRMSCIYGPHQCGSEDQGWIAHFLMRARSGKPITIFGDGRQVRDILYVADAVEAYVRLFHSAERLSGRAFNLGGGPENAVSLLEVLSEIEEILGSPVSTLIAPARPSDQRYYVSDCRSVRSALKLPDPRPWRSGLREFSRWLDCEDPLKQDRRPAAQAGATL